MLLHGNFDARQENCNLALITTLIYEIAKATPQNLRNLGVQALSIGVTKEAG
jgi:hypothetical protein